MADIEVTQADRQEVCFCGDWRSDHPNDGPCNFNGPGFDMCHGGRDCMAYRSAAEGMGDV